MKNLVNSIGFRLVNKKEDRISQEGKEGYDKLENIRIHMEILPNIKNIMNLGTNQVRKEKDILLHNIVVLKRIKKENGSFIKMTKK